MTFIAPAHPFDLRGASFFGRRSAEARKRVRIPDEDGARRALGPDGAAPNPGAVAASLEHLARIALG